MEERQQAGQDDGKDKNHDEGGDEEKDLEDKDSLHAKGALLLLRSGLRTHTQHVVVTLESQAQPGGVWDARTCFYPYRAEPIHQPVVESSADRIDRCSPGMSCPRLRRWLQLCWAGKFCFVTDSLQKRLDNQNLKNSKMNYTRQKAVLPPPPPPPLDLWRNVDSRETSK